MAGRNTTPLDEARIAVIRAEMEEHGPFLLADKQYSRYRGCGLTKPEVNRALATMAERGEVRFRATNQGVQVLLAEPEK